MERSAGRRGGRSRTAACVLEDAGAEVVAVASTDEATAVILLIVDDNEDLRELLAEFLHKQGYSVTTASNGAEALAELEREPRPRIVLLDLEMPVVSGWQLLATVGQDPELATLPIIVVSAARTDITKIPAAGHCRKPIDLDRLAELVARILAHAPHRASARVLGEVVTVGALEPSPAAIEPLAAAAEYAPAAAEDAPVVAEPEPAAGDPAPASVEKIGDP